MVQTTTIIAPPPWPSYLHLTTCNLNTIDRHHHCYHPPPPYYLLHHHPFPVLCETLKSVPTANKLLRICIYSC
ncbi:unnamed protein product [Lactuca virosa]|uniref:Uncharacterized protein n=1 Tax=Lactuca virosa TaxID=75947 RepID=A0AAU9LQW1_9ASTR|nr:unnamed protein product [Lactuca virosa]